MSIGVSDLKKELPQAIQLLADEEVVSHMKNAQAMRQGQKNGIVNKDEKDGGFEYE